MSIIQYRQQAMFIEDVALTEIASQYGTPCYVYSRALIEAQWQTLHRAFGTRAHQICYAVKANSNIAILNLLARLHSGFDIVSQGELERVLRAGGDPKRIVFSGVGKKNPEIQRALEVGIRSFNVESVEELSKIAAIAASLGTTANISLRINPDIDSGSHPYIATGLKENKFGLDLSDLPPILKLIPQLPTLKLIGIACHIGSQLTELEPLLRAKEKVVALFEHCRSLGFDVREINLGGGLGVRYHQESPPSLSAYVQALCAGLENHPFEILIEPGRSIAAEAGILLTRIISLKRTPHKHFAIVDAGMNDLIRPALYEAWQTILPVTEISTAPQYEYDIVGPVCESADFLAKNRLLRLQPDMLLAVCTAGAYGFSMASTYNSRPRPAEVLVDGNKSYCIRARESINQLFADECLLPEGV